MQLFFRLKDYPQYCQHLASISHFIQFPHHLQEVSVCFFVFFLFYMLLLFLSPPEPGSFLVHRVWSAVPGSSSQDAGFNHHPWKHCTFPSPGPSSGPGPSQSSPSRSSEHKCSYHFYRHNFSQNHHHNQTHWGQLQEGCTGKISPLAKGFSRNKVLMAYPWGETINIKLKGGLTFGTPQISCLTGPPYCGLSIVYIPMYTTTKGWGIRLQCPVPYIAFVVYSDVSNEEVAAWRHFQTAHWRRQCHSISNLLLLI